MGRPDLPPSDVEQDLASRDHLTATGVELTIRLGVLAILLYWSYRLVQPFITIAIWSVVLTVALYPLYEWMVVLFGGHRRLAAAVLTVLSLLIVIGPATWLVLGLIESLQDLAERFDLASLALPAPPETIQGLALDRRAALSILGARFDQFCRGFCPDRPVSETVRQPRCLEIGADSRHRHHQVLHRHRRRRVSFLAGAHAARNGQKALDTDRFRTRRGVRPARRRHHPGVSRGVIGISALQAFLVALGLMVAGIPGASLITSAVLILGIIQIGPSIVLIPLIIWSWWAMDTQGGAACSPPTWSRSICWTMRCGRSSWDGAWTHRCSSSSSA